METKFTEQESLAIISKMIEQARNNLQKGGGNTMIFVGLLVAFCAILNAVLILIFRKTGINSDHSMWVWCLTILGMYVYYLLEKKSGRTFMVKTHIDFVIGSTWRGFGYAYFVYLAVIFGMGIGKQFNQVFFLINPGILILIGLAEFVTSKACRFKPYLYGTVIMWVGALCCVGALWFEEPVIIQFFILAFCMITGFAIPGYQLNKLTEKNV